MNANGTIEFATCGGHPSKDTLMASTLGGHGFNLLQPPLCMIAFGKGIYSSLVGCRNGLSRDSFCTTLAPRTVTVRPQYSVLVHGNYLLVSSSRESCLDLEVRRLLSATVELATHHEPRNPPSAPSQTVGQFCRANSISISQQGRP